MATGIKMKPALKRVEADLLEIDQAIGGAHAELVNLAQKTIFTEGFLDGRGETIKGSKGGLIYNNVPGANRTRRPGKNKNSKDKVFHKSKIVLRTSDKLKGIFKQLNFKKHSLFSNIMYSASNEGVEVKIFREGSKIKAVYTLLGEYDKIFGVFHGGSRKIKVTNSKGDEKTAAFGQRKIIRAGISKALRRWDKLNKLYLEQGIKRINRRSK